MTNSEIDIDYKATGKVFKNGISIYELNIVLQEFQSILERSYLTLMNRDRMSDDERKKLLIQSKLLKEGSLITEWRLIVDLGSQFVLPLVATLNAGDVWDLAKQGFDFLKIVYGAKNNGNRPIIIQNNENCNININSKTYKYDIKTFENATKIKEPFKSLNNLIDENKLDKINMSAKSEEIELDEKTKGLFSIDEELSDITEKLNVNLYRYNKFNNKGRLRVINDDPSYDEEDYSFQLENERSTDLLIDKMHSNLTEIEAVKQYIDDPLEGEHVTNIIIKKILD